MIPANAFFCMAHQVLQKPLLWKLFSRITTTHLFILTLRKLCRTNWRYWNLSTRCSELHFLILLFENALWSIIFVATTSKNQTEIQRWWSMYFQLTWQVGRLTVAPNWRREQLTTFWLSSLTATSQRMLRSSPRWWMFSISNPMMLRRWRHLQSD